MSSDDIETTRRTLTAFVNTKLIVKQLNTILKALSLPNSGLKDHLKARLIQRIDYLCDARDTRQLAELKRLIFAPDSASPARSLSHASPSTTTMPRQPITSGPSYGPLGYSQSTQSSSAYGAVRFRPSPFFDIMDGLTAMVPLPVMATSKNIVNVAMRPNRRHIEDMTVRGYRCMLYCAAETPATALTFTDVEFPQQIEIKVNDKVPPGKTKGLKNKPGTTHPLDITDMFAKIPDIPVRICVTYAITQKKFMIIANLVRRQTSKELAEKVRHGKFISKETVLERMRQKNDEDDLVATSTVLSLKCPLSTIRLDIPTRSNLCRHNQCFDAASFLQLQEQAPTWNCPICNQRIAYDNLVVDKYVEDILKQVPPSADSVIVDPTGNWQVPAKESVSPPPSENSDIEDDIIVLKEDQPFKPRAIIPDMGVTTPVSRETSTAYPRASSSKRPVSSVIDLTLSDDEDASPLPPPKRHQSTSSSLLTPNSMILNSNSYPPFW